MSLGDANGLTRVGIMTQISGVRIGMDGCGRWRDNAIVERFRRSIKYEEVHLHAYAYGGEAAAGIGRYVELNNSRRPHSSLEGQTPDTAYFDQLPDLQAV